MRPRSPHVVVMSSAFAALLALAGGCGPEPSSASWEVRFTEPRLREQAVRIETTVVAGGCQGEGLVYRAELGRDAGVPRPPALGPGLYGFAGLVRDADCRTIARGCTEVELPFEGSIELELEPASGLAACRAELCFEGYCANDPSPPDGGLVPDGGSVSPAPDTAAVSAER